MPPDDVMGTYTVQRRMRKHYRDDKCRKWGNPMTKVSLTNGRLLSSCAWEPISGKLIGCSRATVVSIRGKNVDGRWNDEKTTRCWTWRSEAYPICNTEYDAICGRSDDWCRHTCFEAHRSALIVKISLHARCILRSPTLISSTGHKRPTVFQWSW